MPSDQEKLSIAEEITRDCLARLGTLHTDGFDVTHFYDAQGAKFIAWVGHDKKSESRSAIECIHLARQKLAAEKEAARTPEEQLDPELCKILLDWAAKTRAKMAALIESQNQSKREKALIDAAGAVIKSHKDKPYTAYINPHIKALEQALEQGA